MKPMRNISCIPIANARGQALVELALLLPVLLLLVIGSIEFGRAFFLKNMAINAARAGVRTAVVLTTSTWDTSDTGPIKTAINKAITSGSLKGPAVIIPVSAPTVKGQEVSVTVKVKFNTIVPNFTWFPFSNISSVTGRATMRYEGL